MSGFKGPYFVAKTFSLSGEGAEATAIGFAHHASGIPDLKPDATTGILAWVNSGFVTHTGGSSEVNLSLWESLAFASKGPGRRYEDRIHQALVPLGILDGKKAYAFIAPFREVANSFKNQAVKMVADESTSVNMFELELRPDHKLTGWDAASNSITLSTYTGPRVAVLLSAQGLEMHIEGEHHGSAILGKCVREVFARMEPHVVTVDRRLLVAKALEA